MTQPVRHGDPDAMRALASTWLRRAEQLADIGSEITTTVTASGFEGPAALRLGERADMLRSESRVLADALQEQAYALRTDADTVEAMNADAVRLVQAEESTGPEAVANADAPPPKPIDPLPEGGS